FRDAAVRAHDAVPGWGSDRQPARQGGQAVRQRRGGQPGGPRRLDPQPAVSGTGRTICSFRAGACRHSETCSSGRVSVDKALRQYKSFVDSLTPLMESYFKVEDLPDLEGPEGEAAKLLLAKLNEDEREKVNRLFRHLTSTGGYQTLEYLDQ